MQSLDDVKRAITNANLHWEAGTTPIGKDFSAGNFRSFGFAPKGRESSGEGSKIARQTFAFNTASPPPAVDWRDVDGKNYVTPVLDQGQCGACVAFATCSALESRVRIDREDPHYNIELSKAHLFFCGTTNGCQDGWTPANALKRCREHGVGKESDFRYTGKQSACKDIESIVKVSSWKKINDSVDRKQSIAFNGPVIGAMVVYNDFLWYKSGVYRPISSEIIGLHCVNIIGYEDASSCWIVKNSWGAAWGEGGFARIGYGVCGIDAQFPFYDAGVKLLIL